MVKNRGDIEKFVENQKVQLGLSDREAQGLLQQQLEDLDLSETEQASPEPAAIAAQAPQTGMKRRAATKSKRGEPYLRESQTIHARPTGVSKIRSLFFEMALPNEYIVPIGVKDAKPILGGKFFKIGKRFLKFPAAIQTVYFTSDNANKHYQGVKIDGYACWRIDPEKPEIAARNLDFSDTQNPMGNTNRILRTICTEAIRHLIANLAIEEALTKKDEIGRNLKSQLERIEREWGIRFDQVGIERVTILSAQVFDDLQQKSRDTLRLAAAESRMETDKEIEKKKSQHLEEMESLRCKTEKEARILKATTESEIHKVELEEKSIREAEERKAQENRRKAEHEAEERAASEKAERDKRQASREAEIEVLKIDEARKVKMIQSDSETETRIKSADNDAKIVEALVRSDLRKAESRHDQELRVQQLLAERELRKAEDEKHLEQNRLSGELELESARFEQKLKQHAEMARADHEIELDRLESLRRSEEMKNQLTDNRILSQLVEKLPEIASSVEIDRYTVLSGSGESPLSYTLAQIISMLEDSGLQRLLSLKKEAQDGQSTPKPQKGSPS